MRRDRINKFLKAFVIVGGGMLALLVVLLVAIWIALEILLVGKEHPSDAELETLLRTHRPQIDSLVHMIEADKMEVVADDWIRPDSVLSEARRDLYRDLLDRLDVESGVRQYQIPTVELLISTQGLSTGGSAKGLVLHPKDPTPLLPSLDARPPGKNFGQGYKKLWDGWYIFHEWDY
ncbi:MAG: hypothetical protein IPK50_05615 [Fibrobacterota bacterium]|nr:hypothetical protein [Fibrobacterota bacterium]QQS06372.1 MAG: hypothetical protein IPK50_05615 [Fibrobacterota bacterium]